MSYRFIGVQTIACPRVVFFLVFVCVHNAHILIIRSKQDV